MYKLHSKMELWADDSESQFAIIADSQVLAKTDESIFTKKWIRHHLAAGTHTTGNP
jgi:hypothetical protein